MQSKRFDDAITTFPAAVRELLLEDLSHCGVLPRDRVSELLAALGVDIWTLMIRLLPVAAAYARPAVSDYYVGAVALGMPPASPESGPGSLYFGSNMEFPGQALSACVHGEQSATNNAWLHDETGLRALAINAAPCGYCRQFLNELSNANDGFEVLLRRKGDVGPDAHTRRPFSYYLPDAFGPKDHGLHGGLMKAESHDLTVSASDALSTAALTAANASYSPYKENFSGVALRSADGNVYAGRYAENAAANPSLSPLQSALAFMSMNLPVQSNLEIRAATLVERESKISQRSVTEAVLSAVAPAVALEYVPARAS